MLTIPLGRSTTATPGKWVTKMTASLASIIGVAIFLIVVLTWIRHCIQKNRATTTRALQKRQAGPQHASHGALDLEDFRNLESVENPPDCYRKYSKCNHSAQGHELPFDDSLRLFTISGLDSPIRPVALPPMPRLPKFGVTGVRVDEILRIPTNSCNRMSVSFSGANAKADGEDITTLPDPRGDGDSRAVQAVSTAGRRDYMAAARTP